MGRSAWLRPRWSERDRVAVLVELGRCLGGLAALGGSGLRRWPARRGTALLRRRARLTAQRFGFGLGVEVVDLLGGEGHRVDRLAVALVVVVLHPADHVDVAALGQVLRGVLGLLAPQGPQDRGRLLAAVVQRTLAGVADRGQRGLAHGTVAALDGMQ